MADKSGEANPNCKMTESQAREVKRLISGGLGAGEVARAVGVSRNQVNGMIYNGTWSHVPWPEDEGETVEVLEAECPVRGCTNRSMRDMDFEGRAGLMCETHSPVRIAARNKSIRQERDKGVPYEVLAATWGLSRSRIVQIYNGDKSRNYKYGPRKRSK